jgi:hypothetical protein
VSRLLGVNAVAWKDSRYFLRFAFHQPQVYVVHKSVLSCQHWHITFDAIYAVLIHTKPASMTVEVLTQVYQAALIGLWHENASSLLPGKPMKRNQFEDQTGESRIML